jgi:phosphatidylglycerophosphate synthase
MDMHRSTGAADWHNVPASKQNFWQRLAVRTSGIVTPANMISVGGGLLGAAGLVAIANSHGELGVTLLIIGRLADIADGAIAQATGTKSPLGEAVDATIDKLICGGVLLVFALEDWMPLWIVGLLALHTIVNSAIGLTNNARRLGIHPTRTGKIGATLVWVALIGFGLLQLSSGGWNAFFTAVTSVAVGGALLLSYASSFQYGRAAIRALQKR